MYAPRSLYLGIAVDGVLGVKLVLLVRMPAQIPRNL